MTGAIQTPVFALEETSPIMDESSFIPEEPLEDFEEISEDISQEESSVIIDKSTDSLPRESGYGNIKVRVY